MIKEAINKLINKEELNQVELRETFDEIFSGLAIDVEGASFLSLLNQFDDNVILSAINSAESTIKKPFAIFNNEEAIQNTVFQNKSECINISLIQDLICATAGLPVFAHNYNNSLSINHSFDILQKMGVNIDKEIDYNSVEYENLNFGYFYISEQTPHFKYSENIRKALPFNNVLDLVLKLVNPLNAKNLFFGVNSKDDVNKYANIALELGKVNSIIVCGNDNFPYISLERESNVAEAWKNKIFTYVVTPELLGFNNAEFKDIVCENDIQQSQDIFEIIQNKRNDAKYDIAVINSGLSLYIAKKSNSIIEGIELAKKLIATNKVFEKFEQIKRFYS